RPRRRQAGQHLVSSVPREETRALAPVGLQTSQEVDDEAHPQGVHPVFDAQELECFGTGRARKAIEMPWQRETSTGLLGAAGVVEAACVRVEDRGGPEGQLRTPQRARDRP